jgi:hypothetical protein
MWQWIAQSTGLLAMNSTSDAAYRDKDRRFRPLSGFEIDPPSAIAERLPKRMRRLVPGSIFQSLSIKA